MARARARLWFMIKRRGRFRVRVRFSALVKDIFRVRLG